MGGRGYFIISYSPNAGRGFRTDIEITSHRLFWKSFLVNKMKCLSFLWSEKVFQLQEKTIYPASLTLICTHKSWTAIFNSWTLVTWRDGMTGITSPAAVFKQTSFKMSCSFSPSRNLILYFAHFIFILQHLKHQKAGVWPGNYCTLIQNLLATYFILVILLSISATGAEYKNSLYLLWPLCKSVLFSPLFRLKHIHTRPCQGLCKKKITRVDPLVLISRESTAAHPAARLLQLPSCFFSSPKLSSFTIFFSFTPEVN